MYAKNIRPSAKRDNRITRPRRAQTCLIFKYPNNNKNLFYMYLTEIIILLSLYKISDF